MSYPVAKLSEIAPSKPLKINTVSSDYQVWQLTLEHIESNTGILLRKEIHPFSKAGSSTHWFNEHHVLYSKLRPYLNKVLLPDQQGIGTTELIPMLPDAKRLDRKYLAYYLKSTGFVEWISNQTAGAKMPRVAMDTFWNHEIPLPPLAEQKRIAAILDKADAIRRKRQQAIQLADHFLRSVFLDMFGDPVTNPKGWEVKPLKHGIKQIVSGWSVSGENYPAKTNDFGVLKISSVTSGEFIAAENKLVQPNVIPENKLLIHPKTGDLLFSRANTRELVAATAIVNQDFPNLFLPDKLWRIDFNKNTMIEAFFHYLLKHEKMRDRLTSQATGTSGSMLNISQKKLEETVAIFPPIALQNNFLNIVRKVKTIKKTSEFANKATEMQFNSLSQKAFSGQL